MLKLYDPRARAHAAERRARPPTWAKWDAFAKAIADGAAARRARAWLCSSRRRDGPTFERLLEARAGEAARGEGVPLRPAGACQRPGRAPSSPSAPARARTTTSTKAKVVFALESDFLVLRPRPPGAGAAVRRRRARSRHKSDVEKMKRLYVAGGRLVSTTGTNADHRLRVASGQGVDVLKALAKALGAARASSLGALAPAGGAARRRRRPRSSSPRWRRTSAANKGRALVSGGRAAGRRRCTRWAAPQRRARRAGRSDDHDRRATPTRRCVESLAALTKALSARARSRRWSSSTATRCTRRPARSKFAEALAKAKTVIHAGVLPEETGAKATWHLPLAHFLESWGDAQAWDGTVSLVQPLILPLFGARAGHHAARAAGRRDGDQRQEAGRGDLAGPGQAAGRLARPGASALHDGVVAHRALELLRPPRCRRAR